MRRRHLFAGAALTTALVAGTFFTGGSSGWNVVAFVALWALAVAINVRAVEMHRLSSTSRRLARTAVSAAIHRVEGVGDERRGAEFRAAGAELDEIERAERGRR